MWPPPAQSGQASLGRLHSKGRSAGGLWTSRRTLPRVRVNAGKAAKGICPDTPSAPRGKRRAAGLSGSCRQRLPPCACTLLNTSRSSSSSNSSSSGEEGGRSGRAESARGAGGSARVAVASPPGGGEETGRGDCDAPRSPSILPRLVYVSMCGAPCSGGGRTRVCGSSSRRGNWSAELSAAPLLALRRGGEGRRKGGERGVPREVLSEPGLGFGA